jgi:DNA (cytosine-5)-methyltransferase 1
MKIGSLCTGYGGLDMAARAVFGGELAWWSDIEPGPIAVMSHHHPDVPNLGDLKEVDWFSVPEIDILTAGYPCQPFSNAGKRLGTEDPRHIWPWISDAIGLLRPRIVLLENVAAHLRRGFDIVSADLANLGYRVAWGLVSASEVGAAHGRKRLYVVAADASRELDDRRRPLWPVGRPEHSDGGVAVANAYGKFLREQPWWGRGPYRRTEAVTGQPGSSGFPSPERWGKYADAVARWEQVTGVPAPDATVPNPRAKVGRSLSPYLTEWLMGVPGRITSVPGLDRNAQIKLAGNGVVPQQAELAIRQLLAHLEAA